MKLLGACVLLCLTQAIAASGSALSGLPQATARIQAATTEVGEPFPLVNPEIRVFKTAHRLELWASGKQIKAYRVALGHRGLADKRKSGDHLTPEGRFYLCARNAQSAFHLFLGISYPSEVSATRGLRDQSISPKVYRAIVAANRRRICPPWDTTLGGTVGIHGHGSDSDWTWGCVALTNAEVDELWVSCPLGTPIIISP